MTLTKENIDSFFFWPQGEKPCRLNNILVASKPPGSKKLVCENHLSWKWWELWLDGISAQLNQKNCKTPVTSNESLLLCKIQIYFTTRVWNKNIAENGQIFHFSQFELEKWTNSLNFLIFYSNGMNRFRVPDFSVDSILAKFSCIFRLQTHLASSHQSI